MLHNMQQERESNPDGVFAVSRELKQLCKVFFLKKILACCGRLLLALTILGPPKSTMPCEALAKVQARGVLQSTSVIYF